MKSEVTNNLEYIKTGGENRTSVNSMRTTAFVLSLIGGLVITAGRAIAAFLSAFASPYDTYYGMGPGMMGDYWFGYNSGWMTGLSIVALACGILVLIGATMLNARPAEQTTWGIIILVFSIASFIGMGGYMIGAILGIAGGAIALSYRTHTATQKEPRE
jgi:hypothetical protein